MCFSAYRVSGSPRLKGRGSNLHQNLLWTSGDVIAKFQKDRCRGLNFHVVVAADVIGHVFRQRILKLSYLRKYKVLSDKN